VVGSPWVPLSAIILALPSGLSALATPILVDPSIAARIGPGFTLRDAEPAVVEEMTQGLTERVGDVVVYEVVGDNGSVSFLLIGDARVGPGHVYDLARGLADWFGLTPQLETVEGRSVATAVGRDVAVAAWVEAPLFLEIYAADEPTMRAVLESILRTPRPA
jgi:hypothetical protein